MSRECELLFLGEDPTINLGIVRSILSEFLEVTSTPGAQRAADAENQAQTFSPPYP